MTSTLPVIMTDLGSFPETDIPPGSVLCCTTDSVRLEQRFPYPELSGILSADECRRLNSVTHVSAKKRFILGRLFIRHLLAFYLKQPAGEVIFKYNAHGKPCQQHNSNLAFNLSHTANKFALALSFIGEVGIDIEQHKPNRNIQGIANEVFTANELQWFRELTKQEQAMQFYRLWTLKEATLKAEGSGLNIPMQNFGFKKNLSVAQWNNLLGPVNLWRWNCISEQGFSIAVALKASKR